MPAPSLIYKLPQPIRKELMDRLVQNGFSEYEKISEWLKELGYDISKSAIHRFGVQFKSERGDFRSEELNEITGDAATMRDLRMRCIEAAAFSGENNVLDLAQTYLDWVTQI